MWTRTASSYLMLQIAFGLGLAGGVPIYPSIISTLDVKTRRVWVFGQK